MPRFHSKVWAANPRAGSLWAAGKASGVLADAGKPASLAFTAPTAELTTSPQRALRSNSCGESVHEARKRAGPRKQASQAPCLHAAQREPARGFAGGVFGGPAWIPGLARDDTSPPAPRLSCRTRSGIHGGAPTRPPEAACGRAAARMKASSACAGSLRGLARLRASCTDSPRMSERRALRGLAVSYAVQAAQDGSAGLPSAPPGADGRLASAPQPARTWVRRPGLRRWCWRD